jgi:hypothetical protein
MLFHPAVSGTLAAGLLLLPLTALGCGAKVVAEGETSPASSSTPPDGGCSTGGSTSGAGFPAVYTTLAAHPDWLLANYDGSSDPNHLPPETIIVVLGDNVSCDDPAHLTPPINDQPWDDCASWAWRVDLAIPPSLQHIGSYEDGEFEESLTNNGVQYCDGGVGEFRACITIGQISASKLSLRIDDFKYDPDGADILPEINGDHTPVQCQ